MAQSVVLETLALNYQKARSVNQTSNGYVSKVPMLTDPFFAAGPTGDAGTATGSSVIDLGNTHAQNAVKILPYATGGDNVTFSVRVIGWNVAGNLAGNAEWFPINLGEFACTAGASTGVAGGIVLNTEFFADTIAVTVGSTLSGEAAAESLISPANDTIAHVLVDLKGSQRLELSFTTGGSATDCNALLSFL